MIIRDLTGMRFGKLLVISFVGKNDKGRKTWRCLCDCGKEKIVTSELLKSGRTKSCGCLLKKAYNKIENREFALKKRLFHNTIIKRSKKLNLKYDIDLDYFIQLIDSNCYYCGRKFSNKIKDITSYGKIKYTTSDTIVEFNGIDRIDSEKGYIVGNVVPCCRFCNTAKGSMSITDFSEYITNIYTHYILKNDSQK